jgi:hypothetical protein
MSSLMSVKTRKGTPATIKSIAAFEFAAVKEFRNLSKVERLRNAHGLVDRVRPMAVIAGEILAVPKEELIAKVADGYEILGPCLMQLADAKDDARALMELIGSAEVRLAVALANVEGDEGDGAQGEAAPPSL